MPDGKSNFTTRLVSHNGGFTSFNGTENSNEDLVKKAGLQSHVNCSPYLANVKANLQSKVRVEFILAQELDIVIPRRQNIRAKHPDKCALKGTVQQIMEDRRPIELELEEKREKLKALELYIEKYSDNEIIPLCSLKLETYQIMALKKITTKYGDKFIMVLELNGCLKVCYLNKYLEDRIKEFLGRRTSKPLKIQREAI